MDMHTLPTLNVIVPFSRPQNIVNVLNNFHRQTYYNKKLIIVENGEATGRSYGADKTLTSNNHQAIAKNTAIDYLKSIGESIWVTFDDDDFYGSEYLTEVVGNIDKAEVIGKHSIFIRHDDDLYFIDGLPQHDFTTTLNGPTICSRTEYNLYFPDTGKWGEDNGLCEEALLRGYRLYSTSQYNFCYYRGDKKDHTYKASINQMIALFNDSKQVVVKKAKYNEEILYGKEFEYKVEEKRELEDIDFPSFTEMFPNGVYEPFNF
jgi:glycosyltransferase involved in cell wall biosynthesis